jgi:hypothetical protein
VSEIDIVKQRARDERALREASEARWLELGGALGEAKGSAELMHDRGTLPDELFWESIGALDGMLTLVDDVIKAIASGLGH